MKDLSVLKNLRKSLGLENTSIHWPTTPPGSQSSSQTPPSKQTKMGQFSSEAESEISNKKFLIVGGGDCGKSTLFKNINMSNNPHFLEKKKKSFRDDIYRNILESMSILCQYCLKKNLKFKDSQNKNFAQKLIETNEEESVNIQKIYTKQLHGVIMDLWSEPEIQKAVEPSLYEFHLFENAKHFLKDLQRFDPTSYEPTEEDIILSTKKTTGINSFEVSLNFSGKDISCTIIDTGGQRNERKKWKQCYPEISALIYVASLSEYDQLNYEDDKKNRMLESISIFESILSDKSLENIPIFLIFNKLDLFEVKMKTKDLSETFPDYDELPSSSSLISSKKLQNCTNKVKQPKSDFSHAIEFIRNQFLEKNSRENVFVLYTVASNKDTLKDTMTDFLTLLYSCHAPVSKNQKKKK